MVSEDLLRRYRFFDFLDEQEFKVALDASVETTIEDGHLVFDAGQSASALYFLIEGSVEHRFVVIDEDSHIRREFLIGNVNAGEMFGLSGLIEPHRYTTAARAVGRARVLKVDAGRLRQLCAADKKLAYSLLHETAKGVLHRINQSRTRLAALIES